jgi:hypothetical protein
MEIVHHAELIFGQSVKSVDVDLGSETVEKIDLFFDKLGINDARDLVKKAHTRPVNGSIMVIIVRTDFIGIEAQNALLKVIEEPPESTRFVFVVAQDFSMIPTLRSRFSLGKKAQVGVIENIIFDTFLSAGYQERLSSIDKAIKGKDTDWQKAIKRGLIQHVTESKVKSDSLSGLEYSARTLLTRGASNKMLLEHSALLLGARL